jgi:hypothetical protein
MIFTVVIPQWSTGDAGNTSLLDPVTQMRCCLGFALKDCGVPDSELENVGDPEMVDSPEAEKFASIFLNESENNNEFTNKAIEINDADQIDDDERMTRLQVLAKQYGHEFVFVEQ